MRAVAEQLANVPQKKSLIYFSSGMERTGIENQSELRAAINAAVLANLSIYTLDIRGLQALPPGGEAQNASLRGTSAYSGQSQLERAEFQLPDPGNAGHARRRHRRQGFSRLQRFRQGLQGRAGRHVDVLPARLSQHQHCERRQVPAHHSEGQSPGVKIDARRGYYAEADFQHSNKDDRERQLQEELASDLPSTDLPVYLATAYFRVSDNRFYVPMSLIVPGSEIPFSRSQDQDKATLDILAVSRTRRNIQSARSATP